MNYMEKLPTPTIALKHLAAIVPEIEWHGWAEVKITAIEQDSRLVTPGTLFVAVSGTRTRGIEYIEAALEHGAVAIIASEYRTMPAGIPLGVYADPAAILGKLCSALWANPERALSIIGITGTNGKTTTAFLLRHILAQAGYATALIGTVGYDYGTTTLEASHTTPDPVALSQHLAGMAAQQIRHLVMEVSSHALVQQRVAHLNFQAAVFTNLTRDHLDYHGDMENYLQAKALLFKDLRKTALAIFNHDDAASQRLRQYCPAATIFYALAAAPEVAIYAHSLALAPDGSRFTLVTPPGEANIELKLPGRYNIYNALAAAACAFGLGIPLSAIVAGLNGMATVPGRMEAIRIGQPFAVIIDFAHSSDALQATLAALPPQPGHRRLLVFGCGGDRDRGKRALMGEVACHYADFSWITSDNPRSESPERICHEIARGFSGSNHYRIVIDRAAAIEAALASAQPGDTVVIAGKGHETRQIIGDRTLPFSDREVICNWLRGRDWRKS